MVGQAGVRRGAPVSAAVAATLLLLGGCTSGSAAPRDSAAPVPLDKVDLSGVSAVRAPYCETLDERALSALLGGRRWRDSSYAPGDRVRLSPGLRDVAHEYGCTFRRRGITARTWVFAQPVTRRQARGYLADRRGVPGCRTAGVLRFGFPGVVQACRPARRADTAGAAPGTDLVTMAGLFGSGYLTCQVSVAAGSVGRDDLLDRAQRWCASVATTVGTG